MMSYQEDCPDCIGDGYFDIHCTYCDDGRFHCKECDSIGFKPSITGKGCTFCDGTEGGNPPDKE